MKGRPALIVGGVAITNAPGLTGLINGLELGIAV